MQTSSLIYYTGIGCKENGKHTESQFLEIMNNLFTLKLWTEERKNIPEEYHKYQLEHQLKFKDWRLPEDFVFFSLDDWLEYSGAIRL
jgi:hypothetical protein